MAVPSEIIERAVRDKINAAIASQLGDPEVLIQKLVGNALSQKCNAAGNVSKSNYDNKFEFLDTVMGNFVRDAAKEALKEYCAENLDLIKESVKKNIARSPAKFAKVFTDGLMNNMNSNYSSTINIEFKTKNNY